MLKLFKKKAVKITLMVLALLLLVFLLLCLILIIPSHGTPSTQTWWESDPYIESDTPHMVIEDDEDFKILVLSDIQIDVSLPIQNRQAFVMIRKLIQQTEPDLILTTGDNTMWAFCGIKAKQLVKYMDSFEIPWAVTLGNHDAESRTDRAWHGNQYESGDYSLFRQGPSNIHGVGNYAINLKNSSGDIVTKLILMDSNADRLYEEGRGYDFIYQDQIDWYKWQIEGVSRARFGEYAPEKGSVVPSLLLFHIPLPEFKMAKESWESGSYEESTTFGELREDIYCAKENSGFFDVIKEMGSTKQILNGHDHVNNLSILHEGIRLTYGLKTGPASYSDRDMEGGTLITVDSSTYETTTEHIYIR